MLLCPDFKRIFTLCTDASSIGLGAVLEHEGHTVAYFSRALRGEKFQGNTGILAKVSNTKTNTNKRYNFNPGFMSCRTGTGTVGTLLLLIFPKYYWCHNLSRLTISTILILYGTILYYFLYS